MRFGEGLFPNGKDSTELFSKIQAVVAMNRNFVKSSFTAVRGGNRHSGDDNRDVTLLRDSQWSSESYLFIWSFFKRCDLLHCLNISHIISVKENETDPHFSQDEEWTAGSDPLIESLEYGNEAGSCVYILGMGLSFVSLLDFCWIPLPIQKTICYLPAPHMRISSLSILPPPTNSWITLIRQTISRAFTVTVSNVVCWRSSFCRDCLCQFGCSVKKILAERIPRDADHTRSVSSTSLWIKESYNNNNNSAILRAQRKFLRSCSNNSKSTQLPPMIYPNHQNNC